MKPHEEYAERMRLALALGWTCRESPDGVACKTYWAPPGMPELAPTPLPSLDALRAQKEAHRLGKGYHTCEGCKWARWHRLTPTGRVPKMVDGLCRAPLPMDFDAVPSAFLLQYVGGNIWRTTGSHCTRHEPRTEPAKLYDPTEKEHHTPWNPQA